MMLAYFFFLSPPFVFAVPRDSLPRFFLCLPIDHTYQHPFCQFSCPSHRQMMEVLMCIRTLLPARLLNLGRLAVSHQPVVWLELLHRLGRIVDKREAGALAATELCAEAKARDLVLGGLVEFGELGAEFVFGDIRAVRVEDVTVLYPR